MISVIIPLYNKTHTIVNTLKTVIAQEYQDFEVIIVDDGSTDDGVAVIENNFNDSRIRIIRQKNGGVSSARNRGANEAISEWIVFLDGDDEWQPGFLAEILHLINNHPDVDLVGTSGYYKDAGTGRISPMVMNKYVDREAVLNYFINPDKMPHLGATAIRKKTFMDIGGFPSGVRCAEDLWLLYKIALNSKIAYSGRSLHVYVGNVEGQTTRSLVPTMRDYENIVSLYVDVYNMWTLNRTNNLVPVFFSYIIYHRYLGFFKSCDYDVVKVFSDNLSYELKKLLGFWFVKMSYEKKYRKLLIFYIIIRKLLWRMHDFPRVGEKIDKAKEIVEKYVNIS